MARGIRQKFDFKSHFFGRFSLGMCTAVPPSVHCTFTRGSESIHNGAGRWITYLSNFFSLILSHLLYEEGRACYTPSVDGGDAQSAVGSEIQRSSH